MRNIPVTRLLQGIVSVLLLQAATCSAQSGPATGSVVACGRNDDGQTNVPPNLNDVVAVADDRVIFAGMWANEYADQRVLAFDAAGGLDPNLLVFIESSDDQARELSPQRFYRLTQP